MRQITRKRVWNNTSCKEKSGQLESFIKTRAQLEYYSYTHIMKKVHSKSYYKKVLTIAQKYYQNTMLNIHTKFLQYRF